jgi:hypothetical protein
MDLERRFIAHQEDVMNVQRHKFEVEEILSMHEVLGNFAYVNKHI